jgi:sulfonate transport system substrate-binding protein
MKTIRVGGVPEHFNYPWHYGIAEGIFASYGLTIVWVEVKGGSGAMCKMLERGELDVALVLTEGIVKHIHNGGKARIIQQFVKSPLIWGVHSTTSKKLTADNLSNATFARSKVGSGSHLMSYVHAQQEGYDLSEANFVTVENIEGAVSAMQEDKADILLWEKFMTQPYVSAGKINRIGLCVSPWPCFMLVGSANFLQENQESISSLCTAINAAAQAVTEKEDTVELIAQMYNLAIGQVAEWYATVDWQTSQWLSRKMLQNVSSTLDRIGILTKTRIEPGAMCYANAKLY